MQEILGLGGAPLGNLFAAMTDAAATSLVRHAIDRGVRYIDTAPHYGHGLSEHRIGAALRESPRDAFVLSTKVGRLLKPDCNAPRDQHGYVHVLPFVQHWDYSHDGTLRSIDDSLQRFGMARIDYAFIHDVARDAHGDDQPQRFREAMDGAVPALARLKAEGAIAGFGLGVNDWQVCVDALAHADLDVLLVAGRYTLLDQTALPELLPLCVKRNVRVVLGGPFNSGILATGTRPADGCTVYFNYAPASPGVLAHAAAIEDLCAVHDVPLKAAALQFPRAHPAIACVLAGARSTAELDENVALATHPIPDDFWRELRARRLVADGAPLPGDLPR
ncbi:MAG: aldo/keto reductase [Betaproteobacteria bacterium]